LASSRLVEKYTYCGLIFSQPLADDQIYASISIDVTYRTRGMAAGIAFDRVTNKLQIFALLPPTDRIVRTFAV
jgi:hypothetical protein